MVQCYQAVNRLRASGSGQVASEACFITAFAAPMEGCKLIALTLAYLAGNEVMEFRQITFNSEEYRQALQLREATLRRPLGLTLSAEDLAGEDAQYHFGLFEGQDLLASATIKPLDQEEVKLRQMCVAPQARAKNLGRRLIRETEEVMVSMGYRRIVLAARVSAAGFYRKLGYVDTSETYLALGIEHVDMSKYL